MESSATFCAHLLNLSGGAAQDPAVRQAAATCFKNVVRRNWVRASEQQDLEQAGRKELLCIFFARHSPRPHPTFPVGRYWRPRR